MAHLDIVSHLLSAREDTELLEPGSSEYSEQQDLIEKLFPCVKLPPNVSLQAMGERAELSQLGKNFVVDRLYFSSNWN